jgi:hypothetical protein
MTIMDMADMDLITMDIMVTPIFGEDTATAPYGIHKLSSCSFSTVNGMGMISVQCLPG